MSKKTLGRWNVSGSMPTIRMSLRAWLPTGRKRVHCGSICSRRHRPPNLNAGIGTPGCPPSTTSRGRFSVKKKSEAVLRLMRGESLDIVSRDLGVTAARLSEWRDQFHAGAQAALRSRPSDERDENLRDLLAKVGELTMDNELLREKIDRLEVHRPLAHRRSRK